MMINTFLGDDHCVVSRYGDIMKLQERKLQRLKGYDYSQNGAYFITICTQNRLCLFGDIYSGSLILNNAGKMVFKKLEEMPKIYSGIKIDKFIVMPNHLHAIIEIQQNGTTQGSFPTISECIQRFKTYTTKLYIDGVKKGNYPHFDKKIWQKSFYDRIIRNEHEYQEICQYIETNPLKWEEDKYYI